MSLLHDRTSREFCHVGVNIPPKKSDRRGKNKEIEELKKHKLHTISGVAVTGCAVDETE